MDATTWDNIGRLMKWLDDEAGDRPETETRLLRVLKIVEEAGEVAEAVHGAVGGNPRKGASHSWGDVRKELTDVIVTAMVALSTLTPEPEKEFGDRLQHLVDRVLPQE
ncbi:MazG-like family protein [Streptomyces sp. NPDC001552]|uniref:MazG-like family protein n=1 Tax=Streptomyces sp. NPDC001552 TaxID=3364587 RepID=UPI0036BA7C97